MVPDSGRTNMQPKRRSFISIGRGYESQATPMRQRRKTKNDQKCGRTWSRTAAGQGTTPRRARSEKKSHQSPEVAPAHRFEGAAVFLRAGPAMKTARFGASFFEIKPVFLKQFLKVRGPDARAALKAAQTGYPF